MATLDVRGRKMTSHHSIQMDLKNAGANWVNSEVVVDAGLVTSRKPSDIPAFNRKMIEEFEEGLHGGKNWSSPGGCWRLNGSTIRFDRRTETAPASFRG